MSLGKRRNASILPAELIEWPIGSHPPPHTHGYTYYGHSASAFVGNRNIQEIVLSPLNVSEALSVKRVIQLCNL